MEEVGAVRTNRREPVRETAEKIDEIKQGLSSLQIDVSALSTFTHANLTNWDNQDAVNINRSNAKRNISRYSKPTWDVLFVKYGKKLDKIPKDMLIYTNDIVQALALSFVPKTEAINKQLSALARRQDEFAALAKEAESTIFELREKLARSEEAEAELQTELHRLATARDMFRVRRALEAPPPRKEGGESKRSSVQKLIKAEKKRKESSVKRESDESDEEDEPEEGEKEEAMQPDTGPDEPTGREGPEPEEGEKEEAMQPDTGPDEPTGREGPVPLTVSPEEPESVAPSIKKEPIPHKKRRLDEEAKEQAELERVKKESLQMEEERIAKEYLAAHEECIRERNVLLDENVKLSDAVSKSRKAHDFLMVQHRSLLAKEVEFIETRNKLKADNEALRKEKDGLEDNLLNAGEFTTNLQAEKDTLAAQLQGLIENPTQCEPAVVEFVVNTEQIETLQNHLDQCRSELRETKLANEKLTAQIENDGEEILRDHDKIIELVAKEKSLRAEKEQLSRQLLVLQKAHEDDKAVLMQTVTSTIEQVRTEAEQHIAMERALAEATRCEFVVKGEEDAKTRVSRSIAETREEIGRLRVRLLEYEQNRIINKVMIETLQNANDRGTARIKELTNEASQNETALSQSELANIGLTTEIELLRTKINTLEAEQAASIEALNETNVNISKLNKQLYETQSARATAEANLKFAKDEEPIMRKKIDEARELAEMKQKLLDEALADAGKNQTARDELEAARVRAEQNMKALQAALAEENENKLKELREALERAKVDAEALKPTVGARSVDDDQKKCEEKLKKLDEHVEKMKKHMDDANARTTKANEQVRQLTTEAISLKSRIALLEAERDRCLEREKKLKGEIDFLHAKIDTRSASGTGSTARIEEELKEARAQLAVAVKQNREAKLAYEQELEKTQTSRDDARWAGELEIYTLQAAEPGTGESHAFQKLEQDKKKTVHEVVASLAAVRDLLRVFDEMRKTVRELGKKQEPKKEESIGLTTTGIAAKTSESTTTSLMTHTTLQQQDVITSMLNNNHDAGGYEVTMTFYRQCRSTMCRMLSFTHHNVTVFPLDTIGLSRAHVIDFGPDLSRDFTFHELGYLGMRNIPARGHVGFSIRAKSSTGPFRMTSEPLPYDLDTSGIPYRTPMQGAVYDLIQLNVLSLGATICQLKRILLFENVPDFSAHDTSEEDVL